MLVNGHNQGHKMCLWNTDASKKLNSLSYLVTNMRSRMERQIEIKSLN